MKIHALKTLPTYFKAVAAGTKTFELRKNDRDFNVGDGVILKEWNMGSTDSTGPERVIIQEQGYTGREIIKTISYILVGGRFGLAKGYVILALSPYNI